ncbi:MAG TPA: MFS transporter [Mycobacteriales bacterium]|jgi:EmrB/QacA subfamily drug resistance transporter|nr:MFS transporter [Mycobacteriales bacterium]
MTATAVSSTASGSPGGSALDPRRWWILAVLGVAQLMVVLDATIVNIALPSAQHALGFSDSNRQWIITAYALAFGSLLLLGGRLSDLVGRKLIFLIGVGGFAIASAIGGFADGFGVLVTARALQGAFGAMLAPAALSLLTTTFHEPSERGKAFAVFGGLAGAGGGVGLLLGGVLTEYLSWRWCLYVNLAFAAVAFAGGMVWLHANRASERPSLDVPGAITSAAGLFAIVYGFSHADTGGWANPVTITFLVAGVALLAGFVAIERTTTHPLLPMRVLWDRSRGGSNLAIFFSGAGMFGLFLFLTYYMQGTLGYSPVKTGLAFLPTVVAISTAAGIATTQLMHRVGPRPLIVAGQLLAALGLVLFAQVGLHSGYVTGILPGSLCVGIGLGLVIAPGMDAGTLNVNPRDAGIASSLVNTSQQVGGSIGTALLNTIAASALTGYLADHGTSAGAVASATVHSYTTAFWWSALIFAIGAVVCGLLLRGGVVQHEGETVPVPVL